MDLDYAPFALAVVVVVPVRPCCSLSEVRCRSGYVLVDADYCILCNCRLALVALVTTVHPYAGSMDFGYDLGCRGKAKEISI